MVERSVLGIDLGPNSLGWALLKLGGEKGTIVATGVRLFEAGLDDLEVDGKGKSKNLQRREARSIRRQIERRSRRQRKLLHALQRHGLLPEGATKTPEQRHEYLTKLDKELDSPYALRARALDAPLRPHEVGRALYHMGQRRGFQTNRKSIPKKDEDPGIIESAISELEAQMCDSGARTLGEYLAGINPHEERVRTKYTRRDMYKEEFGKIWYAQKPHHPALMTEVAQKEIWYAIFHQRPLKNQKHLVGECELEQGKKRAPWALIAVQRFRYLQTVNNIEVIDDKSATGRKLAIEERAPLIEALETEGDQSFVQIRKLLGLSRDSGFNLERGGEKKIPGNRITVKLRAVFGSRWQGMTEQERDAVVEDLRSVIKEETLKKRGMKQWGLNESEAEQFSLIRLEDGYCPFSRKAIEKLLPLLHKGLPIQTAIKELFPQRFERNASPLNALPPVKSEEVGEIRNPIVERSLTELRRVINAIVQVYGKPDEMRIELARELRQPAKQREAAWKRMRKNEKERERAAQKIIAARKIQNPTRNDILKVILANECGWKCPYTGKTISMTALFGAHPQFDIEHIIPFNRSLDDSYLNKTLCYAEENRKVKHDRTPYEVYSGTDRWDEIIARVKSFTGDGRNEKLRRFLFNEDDLARFMEGFSKRQLNDTRYAARLAKQYLGLLYGAGDEGVDANGKRRVFATTGPVTAFLRRAWGLNSILGDGDIKGRDDHRHHAVDAIVIALSASAMVKRLSDAAKKATSGRLFGHISPPWSEFRDEVRDAVDKIVASRRVKKRVRGALHEETFYTKPRKDSNGKEFVHVRILLPKLTMKEVERIVDPMVRERVRARLEKLENDPKKFEEPRNLPWLKSGTGGKIPIRKVRVRRNLTTFPVGSGPTTRYVQTDSNHHMEIVEGADGKWEGHVISLYEAYNRLRAKQPVIQRNHGPVKKFLFSLSGGEMIELSNGAGKRELYVVRTVPRSKQLFFVGVNDARMKKHIPIEGHTAYPESLRGCNCRKIVITPLGQVRYAND